MSRYSNKLGQLYNKKIAFLGLGIENYALIKYLLNKKIDCAITICDMRSEEDLGEMHNYLKQRKSIAWKFGVDANKHLTGFDILFRSPGWSLSCPGVSDAQKMGVEISSPMKLFFGMCPTKNIIGVTGTKGKGTTSSLIFNILKAGKKRTWLGGNIGVAPFDFINKIKNNDWVVLELSSFQLEDMNLSPHIAVITNFTKEHLAPADPKNPNYHKSIRDYWRAKLNIIKWQKTKDTAIINKNLDLRFKNYEFGGKKIFFKKLELKSRLVGEHNKENIAAAVAVARAVGIKENVIKNAVAKFKGLEHRIELVGLKNNVRYYDDSFATLPEATITAIKSFDAPIILLAGGAEKKSDFSRLASLIKSRVKFVVLFKGDASPRLKKLILNRGYNSNKIKTAHSMKEAVELARKEAEKGDIVLMSPACASFGMFRNYKERGDLFKKEVKR